MGYGRGTIPQYRETIQENQAIFNINRKKGAAAATPFLLFRM